MIAIAMGVVLAGYAAGIWGVCLVRGYNVRFRDVWKGTWPAAPSTAHTGADVNRTIQQNLPTGP